MKQLPCIQVARQERSQNENERGSTAYQAEAADFVHIQPDTGEGYDLAEVGKGLGPPFLRVASKPARTES